MRWVEMLGLAACLAAASGPVLAEPRWLVCKYADVSKTAQTFYMVFDDLRSTASLFDAGTMVEGSQTSITFQALRSRFPNFVVTYNRNDGALAVTLASGLGGIMHGECRRSGPPPGAPAG